MRLEPEMWDALDDIAARERATVNGLATAVDLRRGDTALTSAVRLFALSYYRRRAAEYEAMLEGGPRARRALASLDETLDAIFGAP